VHTARPDDAAGRVARGACFALLAAVTVALFRAPLSLLGHFAFEREEYSHIVLIPLISASLLLLERKRVFAIVRSAWSSGTALLAAGGVLYGLGRRSSSLNENDRLFLTILAVVLMWLGAFLLCYGLPAFRAGVFPLLLLFLVTPTPDAVLDRVIFWLQTGSAEVSYAIFQAFGVPIFRTGFVFALPGVTIEIAKECSGIRSTLALLITSLVAGHLLLRSVWRKAAFTLATVPLVIVKNGLRIVTLSLLSVYVDPSFLTGRLHRDGGTVFFLLALVLLAPVLLFLQRSERANELQAPRRPTVSKAAPSNSPSTLVR
jgi:exosortase